MEWWRLRRKLQFRLSRTQRKAMSRQIPMTEELFWECLDILFLRHERKKFWELWNRHPEYIQKRINKHS